MNEQTDDLIQFTALKGGWVMCHKGKETFGAFRAADVSQFGCVLHSLFPGKVEA